MDRRDFITLLGGAAAAWPLAAQAQQPAVPVVGYLAFGARAPNEILSAAFRKGLDEAGFVEGRNVTVEYRFADLANDRLRELASELVRRRVAVILASSLSAALAAKAATTTVPIVFRTGTDPVQNGLVSSFNRPEGNITGINNVNLDLGPKQLGLLHELLPGASRFAALVQGNNPVAESFAQQLRAAAASISRPIEIVDVTTSREIDSAFATLSQKRIDALLVSDFVLFTTRRVQVTTLATYWHLPTIYSAREPVEVGGLMSYASNAADQERQAGIYVGRILKGEKPADLPVLRPTKFELVINLQTARTLGIQVPQGLLAIADEVIE
jgi:putative ABC transport system substrate-binding protein